MHLANQHILWAYQRKHAAAKRSLDVWSGRVLAAEWQSPSDIKRDFPAVSFLPENRVIFNIKGNSFRLVCVAYYLKHSLSVLWIGTHAEYSRIRVISLTEEES